MEKRAFFLSIGLSCLAMFLVWQYLQGKDKVLEDEFGLATSRLMVVTTRDILQYETIKPSDVTTIRVPKAMIPPGIIVDPKDVVDAVAAVPMSKGEQLLDNKVISKNVYSGIDTQVAVGRRALSVVVNPRSSHSYLLRPGNRVDVAAHFEYKASQSISEVKVFLQDILLLAVGRTVQTKPPLAVDINILRGLMAKFPYNDPQEALEAVNYSKTDAVFPTVTLEVTPRQAQILTYVQTVFGDSLTLLLRHTDDRVLARKRTTRLTDVMGPDSYMNREKRLPAGAAAPRVKFFDYQGGQAVPIRE